MAKAKVVPLNPGIAERLSARVVDDRLPPSYSDGDGGNSGMDARLVRLETLAEVTEKRLTAIESDTKEIRKEISGAKAWALIIAGTIWASLVGLLCAGYLRLDSKMDTGFAKIDDRFSKVEEKFDSKFDKMDAKFDKIIERLPAPPAKPAK